MPEEHETAFIWSTRIKLKGECQQLVNFLLTLKMLCNITTAYNCLKRLGGASWTQAEFDRKIVKFKIKHIYRFESKASVNLYFYILWISDNQKSNVLKS